MKASKTNWTRILDVPDEVEWDYNLTDCIETWHADQHTQVDMDRLGTRPIHDLMFRLHPAVIRMQEAGMAIDQDERLRLRAHARDLLGQRAELVGAQWQEALGPGFAAAIAFGGWARTFYNRRRKSEVKGPIFNIRSKANLTQLLRAKGMRWPQRTKGTGVWKVDLDVISKLRREYPQHDACLGALWEYAKLEKLRADWLDDPKIGRFLCDDGRLRASIRVNGTPTGRFASSTRDWCARCDVHFDGRNIQNIPKTGDVLTGTELPIRRMFVAPEGRSLVERDYSAIDAWCAARLSQDRVLMRRLEGGRFHYENAVSFFGLKSQDEVTPHLKRLAKVIIYGGFFYGGGTGTLQRSCEKEGIFVTQAALRGPLARAKLTFHRYVQWQQEAIQEALRFHPPRSYTPFMRSRPFAGPTGDWDEQLWATLVSGTATEHLNLAMIDLDESLRLERRFKYPDSPPQIIDHLHDSLIVECGDADVPRVNQLMEQAFNTDRGMGVFGSEAKVGKRLSDMVAL